MKANKRILDLCNVLQLLFLAFFAWVLLDFLRMGKSEREMMAFSAWSCWDLQYWAVR